MEGGSSPSSHPPSERRSSRKLVCTNLRTPPRIGGRVHLIALHESERRPQEVAVVDKDARACASARVDPVRPWFYEPDDGLPTSLERQTTRGVKS